MFGEVRTDGAEDEGLQLDEAKDEVAMHAGRLQLTVLVPARLKHTRQPADTNVFIHNALFLIIFNFLNAQTMVTISSHN